MTTSRDALVAVLASADPGELLTWLSSKTSQMQPSQQGGHHRPRAAGRRRVRRSPRPTEPTSGDRHQGRPACPTRRLHQDAGSQGCARPPTRRLTGNPVGSGG